MRRGLAFDSPCAIDMTMFAIPMNTSANKAKYVTAIKGRLASKAALRTVNSLKNGPNGGAPVIARKPPTHSTPESGHARRHAVNVAYRLRAVNGEDVAGHEKHSRLGQRMVDGVKHRAIGADAPQADADRHDSHVLDTGIGQHPFEIRLPQDESRRHRHG